MLLRAAPVLLLALAATRCDAETTAPSDAGPVGCKLEFIGDSSKDIEMEVTVLGASGAATPIADGAVVPLIFPPQGGRVIFIGVRARNLDPCGVKLTGSVRDPVTKQVRIDGRTMNLKRTDDGWGASDDSDISTFSNVPMCPNEWASTDVFGQEFELGLEMIDKAMRKAQKTMRVVPECAEPENKAQCECICKYGYVLGEDCEADAGAGGGGP